MVSGSAKKLHLCLPNHYCSCESFFQLARNTNQKVMCKHLMAIQLAPVLVDDGLKPAEITDESLIESEANALGATTGHWGY
mmetsp:Transcript_4007/g.8522  ORF Transcript_4007/g.8522 Transcript_4007/m.8522 type:complete len:81 (+) Transcript_4007:98-340(+)